MYGFKIRIFLIFIKIFHETLWQTMYPVGFFIIPVGVYPTRDNGKTWRLYPSLCEIYLADILSLSLLLL